MTITPRDTLTYNCLYFSHPDPKFQNLVEKINRDGYEANLKPRVTTDTSKASIGANRGHYNEKNGRREYDGRGKIRCCMSHLARRLL